jgi:hypothetical protein
LLCPLRQSCFLEVYRPTAPAAPQSPVSANSRPRTVPSSGFAYPRDGFRRASPGPVCFAGTALLGLSLRRFPLLPIRDASRRPAAHMTLDARLAWANQHRPTHRRLLGFTPGRSPWLRGDTIKCNPRSILPWAYSSPRAPTARDGRAFTRPPFASFTCAVPTRFRGRDCAGCSPRFPSRSALRVPFGTATLHEVPVPLC